MQGERGQSKAADKKIAARPLVFKPGLLPVFKGDLKTTDNTSPECPTPVAQT